MIKIPRKRVNIECEGAAAVAMALSELGVEYIEKWTDHDCIDIGKLRFDFYLPKYLYGHRVRWSSAAQIKSLV